MTSFRSWMGWAVPPRAGRRSPTAFS